MNWILWAIAALMVIGSLTTIAQVGKPRKTITPQQAVIATVFNGVFVAALIIGGHLS